MDANGYRPGGAPWESYVTDPGEFPDVNDWRTEVYWPFETCPTPQVAWSCSLEPPVGAVIARLGLAPAPQTRR
jgi:hypothetical protein